MSSKWKHENNYDYFKGNFIQFSTKIQTAMELY